MFTVLAGAGLSARGDGIAYNASIAALMDSVSEARVQHLIGALSGEQAVIVGGVPCTISTRHTNSGTPVQKAVAYVGEHLDSLGYTVEYHTWNPSYPPNVVGSKTGNISPDTVVLMVASLDNQPSGPIAPGADDNASGCCALLIAAELFAQRTFARTIRFVFFTGSEQGFLGSSAYAQRCMHLGENVAGILDAHIIGYNSPGSHEDMDVVMRSGNAADEALAANFADVVSVYGPGAELMPQALTRNPYSDVSSFWQQGYAGVLISESHEDFTPFYHTVYDRLATLDIPYCRRIIQAVVGTFAHLAGFMEETGNQSAATPALRPVTGRPAVWNSCTANPGAHAPAGLYTIHGRALFPDAQSLRGTDRGASPPAGVFIRRTTACSPH